MKHVKVRVCAFILCGALLFGGVGDMTATAADSIDDLEEKLEQLQKDADEYRDKIKDSNAELSDAQDKKEYYDKQIDAVSQQIVLLTEAIDDLDEDIEDAEEELDEMSDALDEQYEQARIRIRALAKTGNVNWFQMLFDADGYADYLLKSKAMECITARDQALLEQTESELSDIQERKERLEEEKARLGKLKQKNDEKKSELDDLCEERKKLISELEKDLEYYKRKVEEAERAEREVDARLEELLKQQSTVSGSITIPLFWPTPELTVITSVYGPRGQIGNLNTSSFHRGYDFARYGDAAGAKIYASESGVVITSTYHWSYGNYVEIDHGYDAKGRRVVTRYAHMSKRYVSVGDTVKRGETVLGLVGSTGVASGAHLHYEVRIDGEAVDSIKQGYLVKPR